MALVVIDRQVGEGAPKDRSGVSGQAETKTMLPVITSFMGARLGGRDDRGGRGHGAGGEDATHQRMGRQPRPC
jgi:hypothetical protein